MLYAFFSGYIFLLYYYTCFKVFTHNLELMDLQLILPEPAATTAVEPSAGGALRYRALYQFDARNHDELSFMPGDIITVSKGDICIVLGDWIRVGTVWAFSARVCQF